MKRRSKILAFLLTFAMILPSIIPILPEINLQWDGKIVNFDLQAIYNKLNPGVITADAAYFGGGSGFSPGGSSKLTSYSNTPFWRGTYGIEIGIITMDYKKWRDEGLEFWPDTSYALTLYGANVPAGSATMQGGGPGADYKHRLYNYDGSMGTYDTSMFYALSAADTPGSGMSKDFVKYLKDNYYSSALSSSDKQKAWSDCFGEKLDVTSWGGGMFSTAQKAFDYIKSKATNIGELTAEDFMLVDEKGEIIKGSNVFKEMKLDGDTGLLTACKTAKDLAEARNESRRCFAGVLVFYTVLSELYSAAPSFKTDLSLDDLIKWFMTPVINVDEGSIPAGLKSFMIAIKPVTSIRIGSAGYIFGDFVQTLAAVVTGDTVYATDDSAAKPNLEKFSFYETDADPTSNMFSYANGANNQSFWITWKTGNKKMGRLQAYIANNPGAAGADAINWATIFPHKAGNENTYVHSGGDASGNISEYHRMLFDFGYSTGLYNTSGGPLLGTMYYSREEKRYTKSDGKEGMLWSKQFSSTLNGATWSGPLYGLNIVATLLPAGESPAPCFDDLDIPNDEKHKLEVIAEPDKFGGDGAEYCPDSDETSKVTVTVDLTRELSDNLQLLAKNVWRALAWSSSTQKNGGEFVLKPALDYEVWAAPASGGGTDGAISVASGVLTSPKKRRGITHPETYWATITSWEEKDEARTAISDTDANPVQKKYLEIVDKGKLFKAKWAGTGPQLDKDKISYWCFPSDSWRTMGDGSTYAKRDNLTGWDAAKDTAAYQTVMRKAIGFEGQTVGAAFDPNKYLGCWEDVYAAIIYLFREISSDPQPAMAANYKQGLFCSIPASKGVGPVKIENLLIPVSLFVPIAPTSEKYYSYFKSGFTDNDPSKTLQAKLRFSKQV